mmetsp:Transcript_1962/g.5764  ORF Transcript_1962/g.5764 Transcript_1962/m.5764 type:complete len:276 (+) Transcript_1962:901-1728(+)
MMTPARNVRKNIRKSAHKSVESEPIMERIILRTPWRWRKTLSTFMTFASRITRMNFMSRPRRRLRVIPTIDAIESRNICSADETRMTRSKMFHFQSGPEHKAPVVLRLTQSSSVIQQTKPYSRCLNMLRSSSSGAGPRRLMQRSTPMACDAVWFVSMATQRMLAMMMSEQAILKETELPSLTMGSLLSFRLLGGGSVALGSRKLSASFRRVSISLVWLLCFFGFASLFPARSEASCRSASGSSELLVWFVPAARCISWKARPAAPDGSSRVNSCL